MKDATNLLWAASPFGSVTNPWHKPSTWLSAVSLLWGEADGEPVLMGAGTVFMKIHRTRSLPFSAPLAAFGYRVLVPDAMGQTRAIVDAIDNVVVQARRQAQIIAWHNGADDLHVLRQLPRSADEPRHGGVDAVAAAWKDRGSRSPSTARCVDTSHDLGPAGLISETAAAHDLEPLKSFAGGQQQASAQAACEALADGRTEDFAPEALVGSVLSSAVTTALLGGKYAGRLHWEGTLSVYDVLEQVAWEAAPSLLGGVAAARSE
ncbi:hypothetical protein [Streptomyces cahuitamycinicus]|uniref:Uncharacterized protein n=1 Tax=Streptomyces cahuitamycinicus TaxID=2070367 RepID=A0A2N8TIN9_9ACTN|nr:hypothetical protein [Streptomyces cahuitamycinicus]PNG18887.1 hypothetical protein C1J00_28695 [Streptomyces cahuitamycinicus]